VDVLENAIYLGRLERLWRRLIDGAELSDGERVIDVGCGSGLVAVWAADAVGERGEVIGIDASEKMIELSSERAKRAGSHARFRLAAMGKLPFDNDYFDVVLSCQALHHVPTDAKYRALSEMKRVLRPAGRLVLCDHGKPYLWYTKVVLFPFRWNTIEYHAENIRGRIPGMIEEVFGNVEEIDRLFGWMKVWRAIA